MEEFLKYRSQNELKFTFTEYSIEVLLLLFTSSTKISSPLNHQPKLFFNHIEFFINVSVIQVLSCGYEY